MEVYRKRSRSDEVVSPREFRRGLIVWVDGPDGRVEYVCTGYRDECIPVSEYRHQQAQKASANRALNASQRMRRPQSGHLHPLTY